MLLLDFLYLLGIAFGGIKLTEIALLLCVKSQLALGIDFRDFLLVFFLQFLELFVHKFLPMLGYIIIKSFFLPCVLCINTQVNVVISSDYCRLFTFVLSIRHLLGLM